MDRPALSFEDLEILKKDLTPKEYLHVLYQNFPAVWIEEYIPDSMDPTKKIALRNYQIPIVNDLYPRKIIKTGRQVGKTEMLKDMILFYCITRPNSKILVVGPRLDHIKNIMDAVYEVLDTIPELKSLVKRKVQNPYHLFLKNGSTVKALTTGEDSGGKGLAIRGTTANVLIVDEADYINDEVMEKVIIPTTNSFSDPIMWFASSPSGRRGYFRNSWDSGQFHNFHVSARESPTWSAEKEARIRSTTTKLAFAQEYEAAWSDNVAGIFSKEDMKKALEDSKLHFPDNTTDEKFIIRNYTYSDDPALISQLIKPKVRILGVDWNKHPNGTRLVWSDFDANHNLYVRGKWKIDTQEFTQNTAMQKIRELHAELKFDFIMVDIGYGSTQLEDMHLYGLANPMTKLHEIVKAVETDSSIEIRDMATGGKRKTYVKNFIVESTVRFMEQHRIRLPTDEAMKEHSDNKDKTRAITLMDALNEFIIDRYTPNGRPVYECKVDDHDVDAFMFTIYGYLTEVIKTQDLWQKMPMAKAAIISSEQIIERRHKENKTATKDEAEEKTSATNYYGTYVRDGSRPRRIIPRTSSYNSTSRQLRPSGKFAATRRFGR